MLAESVPDKGFPPDFQADVVLIYAHITERALSFMFLPKRALMLFMRGPPLRLNYVFKALSLNVIALRIRVVTYEFWKGKETHSVYSSQFQEDKDRKFF